MDFSRLFVFVCLVLGATARRHNGLFALSKADEALRVIIEKEASDVIEITDALEERGLSLTKLFAVRSAAGIENRCLLPGIDTWVATKIKSEYQMDVKTAFLLLGKVGQLLRVSYAGCKGYKCQVPVAKVHSQYQDLIYDSARVGENFVKNAIRALKYHYYAAKRADKDELEQAFKWVTRTASIADKMVTESKYMVDQSEKLKEMTVDAYLQTQTDDVKNKDQIDLFKHKMANMTQEVKRIEIELQKETLAQKEQETMLKAALAEVKRYEKEHGAIANKKIKENKICVPMEQGFGIGGFGITWTTKSCHTELDKGAIEQQKVLLGQHEKLIQGARGKELEIMRMKRDIQERTAKLYGDLAALMEGTKAATSHSDELIRAQASLQISIQVLAMVKTIFLNALNFWMKVAQSATDLGSQGDTMVVLEDLEIDDADAFTELIVESGFSWLALGKVCNQASQAMRAVKADVTAQFIDLPNHAQAKVLIETCAPLITETQELIKALSQDVTKTKKEIEDAEKAVKAEKDLEKEPTTNVLLLE